MPINWNDIPHNSHIQYMEDDCNKNPITQEQIDAGIWEAWELGIPIDAEEAKQPKPGSKARCGANIHAANARIPGAMPEAHIKHSGPAKPQMAENVVDIYLCKPLQPLFSTVTAKVVNQQQGQTPFLSAAPSAFKGHPKYNWVLKPTHLLKSCDIIWWGGVEGEPEADIRAHAPESIVTEVQNILASHSAHPPKILVG